MGSDRARISYNPSQQYRSVVMQQGRVSLEADWNEASSIASEEARLQALDVVGPAGTPDNGYAISIAGGFDFNIGAGTMYVGGVRASLAKGLLYSAQAQNDWMDWSNDPSWVPVTNSPAGNEYVYLFLREQEVGAVEDSDLADIALGGPDTAQRTRLVQHVVRLGTTGTDCASALTAAQKTWASDGFTLNGDNSVSSFAQLQVGFVSTLTPPTACNPTAQGGYLGADNQLIRVQISDASAGNLSFVWGYDDASFLYAVSVASSTSVTLQSAPVDAEHIPQSGQVVEVLLAAAQLSNGQYMAAPTGQLFTLGAAAYDPDTMVLTLPTALASQYGDGTSANPAQVFLRIWQGQQTGVTPGVLQPLNNPVTGANTGITLTFTTADAGAQFRAGDYWMFAVRPADAGKIYPERYKSGPQPPDGPREWICPLAVLGWSGTIGSLVSDCRLTFGQLAAKALHITSINWPNDDLVSLPAFRNNPLQVGFDFLPNATFLSDSVMTVTVEIPYSQFQNQYNGDSFNDSAREAKAISPDAASAVRKQAANLTSRQQIANSQIKVINRGGFTGPVGLFGTKPTTNFNPQAFPSGLLANYVPLIKAAASSTSSVPQQSMQGYFGLIQPGQVSVASGLLSWTLELTPNDLASYLSNLSLAGFGAQVRVRVAMKGRDIWAGSSSPYVYLDGQAFGAPGTRADGSTPCVDLTLPSGSDARASDFESWFWLSQFVWGQTPYTIGDLALCVTTGDFNGDGFKDIAVATQSGKVFILLNDKKGAFAPSSGSPYPIDGWPLSIVAADFNNDGFIDLAVSSYTSGTVTILKGDGTGAFSIPSAPIATGKGAWALATADFNGDNLPDLAVTNAIDGTISVLLNGSAGFAAPVTIPSSNQTSAPFIPIGIVAANLNLDGNINLAVLNAGNNTVCLFTNNGSGTFTQPAGASSVLSLPTGYDNSPGPTTYLSLPLSIVAANFNKNGARELVVGGIYQQGDAVTSYIQILPNISTPGNINFEGYTYYPQVPGIPGALVAANLDPSNTTGSLDLVVTGASFLGGTSSFSVLPGNGDGSFQPPVVYPMAGGVKPITVATADFNEDDLPDLVMTTSDGNLTVLLNEQSQLGVTGAVTITGLSPSGPVTVGSTLQITGTNFDVSINGANVFFNDSQVSGFLAGSSDTQLVVTVPNINPPTVGVSATLTVTNLISSASVQVLVLPLPQPVVGIVTITPGQPSPSPIAPGSTNFPFVLVSNANLPATYSASIDIQEVPWISLAQLFDDTGAAIKNNQVPLTPGQAVTVNVSLDIPQGTATTPFLLGLSVTAGARSAGTSGLTAYTVGESGPIEDSTITFAFQSANPASAVNGQAIQVAQGSFALLTFASTYTVMGNYTITVALVGATNWQATISQLGSGTASIFTFSLTTEQIQTAGGVVPLSITFALEPQAGATSGQVQFTIQNEGVTGNQSATYELSVQ